MSNSVYSLVLSGEVVQAVDALAARQGLSRSALVNHILAEYANLVSPQQYRQEVLASLQALAAEDGLRTQAASSGSVTLRTSLCYKYNPALCYTVELLPEGEGLAQLRVWMRSQNSELLTYFRHFFQLWHSMEQNSLPQPPTRKLAKLENKRYLRSLRAPAGPHSGAEAGEAIAAYVRLLDGCIKTFFSHLSDAKTAVEETTRQYQAGLSENTITKEL